MLTDEEAAAIKRKLREGWRGSALVIWLRRLLDDREERVRGQKAHRRPSA